MRPLVFKAGNSWFVTATDLDDLHFATWREAVDAAFTIARIRLAVSDTVRWL